MTSEMIKDINDKLRTQLMNLALLQMELKAEALAPVERRLIKLLDPMFEDAIASLVNVRDLLFEVESCPTEADLEFLVEIAEDWYSDD